MYLSKIVLKWPACRNPYHWHRDIWRLFPGKYDSKRNFQFTCINRRPGQNLSMLLFSLEKPELINTPEIILASKPKSLENLSFKTGQRLHFLLTANPTKIVTEQTAEKRKVRVPLIKPEHQEKWLKKKFQGSAEIENVISQNEAPLYFSRHRKAGKIVPVLFEGVIKVIDPAKLKEKIYVKFDKDGRYCSGIGPAKAFGCGLLLIKPI